MAEVQSTHRLDHSDLEKGRTNALKETISSGSITINAELFEKLYLSPQTKRKGELRETFGNPTPLPVYFFMGGLLMFLGGVLEWVLGNSFPSIVFCTFGCFWFSLGGILNPSFGAYAFYAPPDAASTAEGLITRGFNASLGFWLLAMGLVAVVFFICALRTNVVFALMFFSIIPAFALLTAAFWVQADDYTGTTETAHKLFVGAGATLLVTCAAGWYILLSIMLAIMEFPFQLPVGDLSTVLKAKPAH
ncbi:hypothetical protein QQX98_003188 [Neonectria punicea]|uniref:GPR1/FUN34/YaaH-class plasma membrane protein n=1 Tax=Neonectria punicea TaxID=979145 RepID=A0ABR1HFK4_9HYPO